MPRERYGRLLNAGVRVTAWDLSREIEWAQTRGHLHAGLLAQVAEA